MAGVHEADPDDRRERDREPVRPVALIPAMASSTQRTIRTRPSLPITMAY
jgi:hypothetical protein